MPFLTIFMTVGMCRLANSLFMNLSSPVAAAVLMSGLRPRWPTYESIHSKLPSKIRFLKRSILIRDDSCPSLKSRMTRGLEKETQISPTLYSTRSHSSRNLPRISQKHRIFTLSCFIFYKNSKWIGNGIWWKFFFRIGWITHLHSFTSQHPSCRDVGRGSFNHQNYLEWPFIPSVVVKMWVKMENLNLNLKPNHQLASC